MGKELVKVNENWNVLTCVKKCAHKPKNVSRVHSIYVVDDEERLKRPFIIKRFVVDNLNKTLLVMFTSKVDYVK